MTVRYYGCRKCSAFHKEGEVHFEPHLGSCTEAGVQTMTQESVIADVFDLIEKQDAVADKYRPHDEAVLTELYARGAPVGPNPAF